MRSSIRVFVAIAASAGLLAACSSKPTSPPPSGNPTYAIGVLADLTGLAASADATAPQGVQAGVYYAKAHGINLKVVVADTATTNVLAAAKQLVEQDHVFAVVAAAGLLQLASPFLAQMGVPVIGPADDGPEWMTEKNMFGVFGPIDATKVVTTPGLFFKMEGVTNVGTIGYEASVEPASSEAALGAADSAKDEGLTVGDTDGSLAYGSVNMAPVATAMQTAGVNGFDAATQPNAALALLADLRSDGVAVKAAVLATGYGSDLQQGGPDALEEAQGAYFYGPFEPLEMQTPATNAFKGYLLKEHITLDPSYAEYAGYTAVAMIVQGLQITGPNPSQAKFIAALNGVKNFNAAGLLANNTVNLGARIGLPGGPNNCWYFTQLEFTSFKLVPNAEPLCGSIVPGQTVSASS